MLATKRTITLIEGEPSYFPRCELTQEFARALWQRYSSQIEIEWPSVKTGHQWLLRARSWAGVLQPTPDTTLFLMPKFPGANLYRMIGYVYGLEAWDIPTRVDTFPAHMESLVDHLCSAIEGRMQRGLYRTYRKRSALQSYIRGRLDLRHTTSRPVHTKLLCQTRDLSADIEANQILLWTLHKLLLHYKSAATTQAKIRRIYHSLRSLVTLHPIQARVCQDQMYNHANQDYQTMHALCRFFLDHLSPLHENGAWLAPSFLIATDQLFERFVASWLRRHLPAGYHLAVQERTSVAVGHRTHFQIDLRLYRPRESWVLDTKYKHHNVDSADIAQVIAYAQVTGAQHAILIYAEPPKAQDQYLDFQTHGIRVQSIAFPLQGDLQENGLQFLAALGLMPSHSHSV